MKPKVVITYPFHSEQIQKKLAPLAHIVIAKTRAKLLSEIKNSDGLISLLTDSIDEKIISAGRNLKVIGNMAVGINNIDLKACEKRGISVVNTPDVLTRATAEMALTLLLAVSKRIPEGEALCRQGLFRGWAPDLLLGLELHGRNAVLVGEGRIGVATSRLFRNMGIRVEWITRDTGSSEIKDKLRRAQILSFHVPLTPKTHHWLNATKLKCLPQDCIVINTSRGPIIDEQALIVALRTKQIFGAGLDVFEFEPKIPSALRKLPNVVLAPHLGSATRETRSAMAELVIEGVLGVLSGKRPWNQVI